MYVIVPPKKNIKLCTVSSTIKCSCCFSLLDSETDFNITFITIVNVIINGIICYHSVADSMCMGEDMVHFLPTSALSLSLSLSRLAIFLTSITKCIPPRVVSDISPQTIMEICPTDCSILGYLVYIKKAGDRDDRHDRR